MAAYRNAGAQAPERGEDGPVGDAREAAPRFMSVKQLARYLQVNEKKVYALANEGRLPASKVTGKWLFPRDLVDKWLLESSHGGLLADRLLVTGSDDPLLHRVVEATLAELQARAIVSYTPTGTQLGLSLLAHRRADVCAIHWGPVEESARRHPALVRQYDRHQEWILVRLFRREQGLILAPGLWNGGEVSRLFGQEVRWAARQEGAGSQRFLQEIVMRHQVDPANQRITGRANSERQAAAMVAMGQADVATGVRAAATEFGLDFLPIGWEGFDLAMERGVFFRRLFRKLVENLKGSECQRTAQLLGGYEFSESGELIWP